MPIKLMAASRRRPGLTRAEYFRYIEHYHGTVARLERFKIEKYIQNHVIDGAFGVISDADGHKNKVADRDAVVELHFDSFRDMLATLEPEGVTASRANQDGRFFADEPTNIIVMAEETELPVAEPHAGLQPGAGRAGHTARSRSCSSSCAARTSSPRTSTGSGGGPTTRPWRRARTPTTCSARSS